MLKEAIILAGGLGTRLRSAVPELPKCLAPVAGRPFLAYIIDYYQARGIEKFIFALGYKNELFDAFLQSKLPPSAYQVSAEAEPLGTGGAIRLACALATEENVLVLNGDTFFAIQPGELAELHARSGASCTLALKPMTRFDRYGVVRLNEDHSVKDFLEKKFYETGLINGGAYTLNVKDFLALPLPEKFSFEKDYLENPAIDRTLSGLVQNGYFIDIGIPADYERAQHEIKAMAVLPVIDKRWSLFLDRDGVINHEKDQSYIFHYGEFVFYDQVKAALETLAGRFGPVVIVTNQRGIGRGLMTDEDLAVIHENMKAEIVLAGGRIDAIYYAVSLDNDHPDRKPNTGMAHRAKAEFPGIDFSRSVMVGNNISDMEFGRNAGMLTVFLKTTNPDQPLPHPAIDLAFDTLYDFARSL